MLARYGKALALAFGITYGLVLMMSSLIATGKSAFSKDTGVGSITITREKRDEEARRKDRKVDRPEKREAPPPTPQKPQLDPLVKLNPNIDTQFGFAPDINVDVGGISSDGDYLPIVKVAPIYPRRALQRGIEGHVLLEFTVTKLGTVVNPVVIESVPPGIFDNAAKKAALKFKYKPKVINGKGVDVAGVQNKLIFRLEK